MVEEKVAQQSLAHLQMAHRLPVVARETAAHRPVVVAMRRRRMSHEAEA
jgi:hypothetical protein